MIYSIDPSIFGDYDIRGIYPKQINEKTCYILGQVIAEYLKVSEIAVGYDCRLSSASLFESLSSGIISQGVDVVDLGLISTEIHNFASGHYHFPANIIITASHNPGNYNGLKIVTDGVVPLHGNSGLPEIKSLVLNRHLSQVDKKGILRKMNINDDWIKHALSFIDSKKLNRLRAVIDAGNGMGGISWQKLIKILPVEIIPLYFEPDGNFPHHLPDPIKKENIKDLKEQILKEKADLGFAIDGDADRLFVLDENGTVLSGTVVTAILAEWFLTKYGPSTILYNAVCGRIVPETVKNMDGVSLRVRVGHSFIKEYMKKYQAIFAGEHSGHFYFQKNFYAESSLITGLSFLEFLSRQNKPLSKIAVKFDKYPSSGEINFKVKKTDEIMKIIKNEFKDAKSIDEIDGLSVWYSNWWFNLRPSKTEPLLRLNLEADNKDILGEKLKIVERLLVKEGGVRV